MTELLENSPVSAGEDDVRQYLNEIRRYPRLTPEEERELAMRCAQGDESAIRQMVNSNLRLVVSIAREYAGRGVALMDLIQEGSLGLWQAIQSYCEGVYADHRDRWIRFYLARAVILQAHASGVGQKMRRAMEDYRQIDERLLAELGRNPTLEEIAEQLHMSPEETEAVKKTIENARLVDRVNRPEEPEDSQEQTQAVEDTALFQMRQRIMELMSVLDETDAKLARLDWTKEERLELVKTMYEVGLPIRSMCLSGHRKYPFGASDPAVRRRSLEIMEKAIQLADDLGVRIIQLAGYDVYYDESTPETVERFGRNLKKAARMAARAGVLMGFETMETEFMNTCEKSMKYVDKINSTYLNVYPDCGNINNAAITYGTDVLADLRSCDGHVVAMHLKETVPGKFRDMMYGEGQVDFPAMINTAWKIGVRRFVTEFWYLGKEDWKADLHFANSAMRKLLDQKEND